MKHASQCFAAMALWSGLAAGAQAANLVVIGHPSAPTLSADQVADVFLGKSQAVTPLDLSEASPLRAEFYRRATGRELPQVKSAWTRLVFSGKGQPPKEFVDVASVKRAVAADPRLVGYIEREALDPSVKVLAVVD